MWLRQSCDGILSHLDFIRHNLSFMCHFQFSNLTELLYVFCFFIGCGFWFACARHGELAFQASFLGVRWYSINIVTPPVFPGRPVCSPEDISVPVGCVRVASFRSACAWRHVAHTLWEGPARTRLRGPVWNLISIPAAQLFGMMDSTPEFSLHINTQISQAYKHSQQVETSGVAERRPNTFIVSLL